MSWIPVIIVAFVAVLASIAIGQFASEVGARQGTYRGGQGR